MLKNPNAGDAGDAVPFLSQEDPPGGGNGNPLQYPCLEESMDTVWRMAVHGVAESDVTEHEHMVLLGTLELSL